MGEGSKNSHFNVIDLRISPFLFFLNDFDICAHALDNHDFVDHGRALSMSTAAEDVQETKAKRNIMSYNLPVQRKGLFNNNYQYILYTNTTILQNQLFTSTEKLQPRGFQPINLVRCIWPSLLYLF